MATTLIKVTANGQSDHEMVALQHIVRIEPTTNGTKLTFVTGGTMVIKASYEMFLSKLQTISDVTIV